MVAWGEKLPPSIKVEGGSRERIGLVVEVDPTSIAEGIAAAMAQAGCDADPGVAVIADAIDAPVDVAAIDTLAAGKHTEQLVCADGGGAPAVAGTVEELETRSVTAVAENQHIPIVFPTAIELVGGGGVCGYKKCSQCCACQKDFAHFQPLWLVSFE